MNTGDVVDWSLFRFMQALPIDACSAMGGMLRDVMGSRVHRVASARARALLAHVRPELAADQGTLDRMMDRLWDSMVRTHVEFAASHRMIAQGRAPIEHPAAFNAAFDTRQPVIAMFLHVGNWELAMLHVAYRAPGRTLLIYDPPTRQARRTIAEQVRGRAPWVMKPMARMVWRSALQQLQRPGGVLLVAADEVADRRVGAPFFDRPPFVNGNLGKIARLALRTGATVLPLWCERRQGAHFITRTLPPMGFAGRADAAGDVLSAVERLNAAITPPVLRLIDQWYMAVEYRA